LEGDKALALRLIPQEGDPVVLHQVDEQQPPDAGDAEPGILRFESEPEALPQFRVTIRLISEIRVALLFEERTAAGAGFRRLYESGLTRAGARLASGNTGERQCIVTGGLGTIAVMHKGQTYYVCCEGCRQAFDDDPEGTIAAYKQRLKDGSR